MKKLGILVLLSIVSAPISAALDDGLVAYYPFNGNANDESGNANDGTVTGAVLTSDRHGTTDSAYQFDGNDSIVADDAPSLQVTNEITLAAWIKLNSSDGGDPIVIKENNNYALFIVDNKVFFYANGVVFQGVTPPQISGSTNIGVGQWYHVTATMDNGIANIFVNGILDVQYSKIGDIRNNSGDLEIGSELSSSNFFNGIVDELRIYNRALSDIEVQQLYRFGDKPQISIKGGFIKLDTTEGDSPLASDCTDDDHEGRMVYDNVKNIIYICSQLGWREIQ